VKEGNDVDKPIKGLRCSIFRSDYRSLNQLLTDFKNVTLVGPEIEAVGGAVFEPNADAPAVKLKVRNIGGIIVTAEPVDKPDGMCGPMAGGTYIATSDSRFSQAIERITGSRFYGAIPLHDYFETWENYNAITRD
jgi:hypothetical protein